MAALRRPTMMDPPVEDLLVRVESKFTLVTLASRRGREINAYYSHISEDLGKIIPPQVAAASRKPLSIALEEIAQGKIVAAPRAEAEGESPAGDAA